MTKATDVRRAQARLVLLFCVTLPILGGCDSLFKGSGVLSSRLSQLLGGSTDRTAAFQAGVLAIGDTMASDLTVNLVAAGLREEQAIVIAHGSRSEVAATAGTVVLGLNLDGEDDPQPLSYAAAPVVAGAVKMLSNEILGLADLELRERIAGVIMKSTFTSLGGLTDGINDAVMLSVQNGMVGAAVNSLNAGGLGGDAATSAVQAVTSGAIEALASSGASDAEAAAANVAAGAIAKLSESGFPDDKLEEIAGAAVTGVVSTLTSAGTGISADALASTVQKVASASVGALPIAADKIGSFAGSIAAGAIGGLAATGVSSSDLVSGGVISSILSGTVGGLSKTSLTEAGAAAAVGAIAGQAVAKIGGSSLSSSRDGAVEQILKGSIDGTSNAGLTAGGFLGVAMGNIVGGAVSSLKSAGFSSADVVTATQLVATTSMKQIGNLGITSVDVATSLSSKVAEGATSAVYKLSQSDNKINATTAAVAIMTTSAQAAAQELSRVGLLSGTTAETQLLSAVASGGFTGLAVSGAATAAITSVGSSVASSTSNSTLQSTYSALASSASTLANQIKSGGIAACKATYGASVTNTAFFTAIKGLPTPIYCARPAATEVCPAARTSTTANATWLDKGGTTHLCELVLTTPQASGGNTSATPPPSLLPACSVIAATTTTEQAFAYFSANYGGVACTPATKGICPTLSSVFNGFLWEPATTSIAGDTCVLKPKGTDTATDPNVFPAAVSCSTIGVTNSVTFLHIEAMTTSPAFPNIYGCEQPTNAVCPAPDSSITSHPLYTSPQFGFPYANASKQLCSYHVPISPCRTVMQGQTSMASSMVARMSARESGFGGTCVTREAACPSVSAADSNTIRLEFSAKLSGNILTRCEYTPKLSSCSSLMSDNELALDGTKLASLAAINALFRGCELPAGQWANVSMTQQMHDAGYSAQTDYGASFFRVGVRTSVPSCAATGVGTTIEPDELSMLGGLFGEGETFSAATPQPDSPDVRACDVPTTSNCPALSVSGWTRSDRTFAELGIKRCFVQETIPSCSSLLADAPLVEGSKVMSLAHVAALPGKRDYFGPYTSLCDAGNDPCPVLHDSLASAFEGTIDRRPVGTALHRCGVRHMMTPCAAVGAATKIDGTNIHRLTWFDDAQVCSVFGGSCPSASTLTHLQLTPSPFAGVAMTRCALTIKAPACESIAPENQADSATLAAMLAQRPAGITDPRATCVSANGSCPELDPDLSNSVYLYPHLSDWRTGLTSTTCRYDLMIASCPMNSATVATALNSAGILDLPKNGPTPGERSCSVPMASACPALANAATANQFQTSQTTISAFGVKRCDFHSILPACPSTIVTFAALDALPILDDFPSCDVPESESCPTFGGELDGAWTIPSPKRSGGTRCSINATQVDRHPPTLPATTTVSAIPSSDSVSLIWHQANDPVPGTAQYQLQYRIYYSTNSSITSTPVADLDSSGYPMVPAGFGSSSTTIAGLTNQTTYFMRLVVFDQSGKRTAYPSFSVTTLPPPLTCSEATSFSGDPGVTENFVMVGQTLYYLSGTFENYVLTGGSVADPMAPDFHSLSSLDGLTNPRLLAHSSDGSHVYIASEEGITPIQVSAIPFTRMNLVDTQNEPRNVTVCGSRMYVAVDGKGIDGYDLSTPGDPTLIATLDLAGGGNTSLSLSCNGPRLYSSEIGSVPGIYVYDIGTPTSISFMGMTAGMFDANVAAKNGPVLYAGRNGGELAVIKTNDPSSIYISSSMSGLTVPNMRLTVSPTQHLVVPNGSGGLRIFNISAPEQPSLRFEHNWDGKTYFEGHVFPGPGGPWLAYSRLADSLHGIALCPVNAL